MYRIFGQGVKWTSSGYPSVIEKEFLRRNGRASRMTPLRCRVDFSPI